MSRVGAPVNGWLLMLASPPPVLSDPATRLGYVVQRIPLGNGQGYFLVDDEDVPLVSRYRWRLHRSRLINYARAWTTPRPNQRSTYAHVLIMGKRGVDHRDGNGLNNTRANLRDATQAQNLQARRPRRGASSRYKRRRAGCEALRLDLVVKAGEERPERGAQVPGAAGAGDRAGRVVVVLAQVRQGSPAVEDVRRRRDGEPRRMKAPPHGPHDARGCPGVHGSARHVRVTQAGGIRGLYLAVAWLPRTDPDGTHRHSRDRVHRVGLCWHRAASRPCGGR